MNKKLLTYILWGNVALSMIALILAIVSLY